MKKLEVARNLISTHKVISTPMDMLLDGDVCEIVLKKSNPCCVFYRGSSPGKLLGNSILYYFTLSSTPWPHYMLCVSHLNHYDYYCHHYTHVTN